MGNAAKQKTALDGYRVVDLTRFESGTSTTEALAWLGADVIKVETPGTGEPNRFASSEAGIDSMYFISLNANKRSITIDLKTETGKELLRDLIRQSDVFTANLGPGRSRSSASATRMCERSTRASSTGASRASIVPAHTRTSSRSTPSPKRRAAS